VTRQRSSAAAKRAIAASGPAPRQSTEEAFLDAAERLLITVGYAGITTRSLADEAGANPGLVHYYFGAMDNLFVRVLERFTERLIARQREMYSSDLPFIDKWRQAVRYLAVDRPYQKIWYELQALAWNRPELRGRVAWVDGQWRQVLIEAFAGPHRAYRADMPLEALVALVITFNEGIILERLSGVQTGQAELLEWIDRWLTEREERAERVAGVVAE
jgi:AcrR family transcriptional regulator